MNAPAATLAPLRLVDALLRAWRGLPTVVRLGGVLAVMGFLWWSSSRTPAPDQPYDPVIALCGNAAHFIAYFGLALAAWLAAPAGAPARALDAAVVALAVGYGVLDEWHQSWVPGRTPSAVDLVTDAFGAAFGAWFARVRLGPAAPGWRRGAAFAACGAAAAVAATFGPW